MVDRPPPSQFAVVERGGRLVVVDRKSGATPPTAAQRMAEHDRRMGQVAVRPILPEPLSETIAEPAPPPKTVAAPTISVREAKREADAARQQRTAARDDDHGKRPWSGEPKPPAPRAASPPPARIPQRAPSAPKRKTIVTAKWWDAKGPRTIELGPKGQAEFTGGFIALCFMLVAVAVVTAFISLPLLFVGGFLLLRFAGKIIAPIGASLIDKALATRE